MSGKVIERLTPEKIAMANKRLPRLRKKLTQLEGGERSLTASRAIRSTKVAIKRWEDILAGRPVY